MEESILISIKKLLGISEEDDSFDEDILIHINSALMILKQLGVPSTVTSIEDDSTTWIDYFGTRTDLHGIKTYIYQKVKFIFDPPASSIVADAMKQSIAEFEFRINAIVDIPTTT